MALKNEANSLSSGNSSTSTQSELSTNKWTTLTQMSILVLK